MAACTIHCGFGAQENNICLCFHCFPFYLPRSDGVGFYFLYSLPISPNEHYLIKIVVRRLPKGFPFFFLSLLEELSIDWNRIILSFIFLAQAVENLPAMQETWVWSVGWEDPLEDLPGEGYLLQYSGLENSMDCIFVGLQRVGDNWATFTSLGYFGQVYFLPPETTWEKFQKHEVSFGFSV